MFKIYKWLIEDPVLYFPDFSCQTDKNERLILQSH